KLGEAIVKAEASADSWKLQAKQGEILIRLAALAPSAEDREKHLRVAVDSYASAASQCPENDPTGRALLRQLPGYLAANFPGSKAPPYAARKEIDAELAQATAKDGLPAAREQHRARLAAFAASYPKAPEAAEALLEAANMAEEAGKKEEAARCYRTLAQ